MFRSLKNKENMRTLTGDRPTGRLHLGHYFGSLKKRIELQNAGYECFLIIADYQVLTDRLSTKDIEKNIIDITIDYLSAGIDPEKTAIFVQSRVSALAELTLLLSMLVSFSKVQVNPTVKEEIKSAGLNENKKVSLGMVSYPVSQAADILLFKAEYVPVGEDQLPHLELTREIARNFNRLYKNTFPLPKPILGQGVSRILGLDGREKMSKSRSNAVFLADSREEIFSKIKKAVTDSGKEIIYNPDKKPAVSNLINIFGLVSGLSAEQIENKYRNKGYAVFKEDLAEAIDLFLTPIRIKNSELSGNLDFIFKVLRDGTERANKTAAENLKEIKSAMKLDYPRIFSRF